MFLSHIDLTKVTIEGEIADTSPNVIMLTQGGKEVPIYISVDGKRIAFLAHNNFCVGKCGQDTCTEPFVVLTGQTLTPKIVTLAKAEKLASISSHTFLKSTLS